jgi:hypothetical protein
VTTADILDARRKDDADGVEAQTLHSPYTGPELPIATAHDLHKYLKI